ncbi:hypothetical protein Tco_0044638 [Tanacetum coccineum]
MVHYRGEKTNTFTDLTGVVWTIPYMGPNTGTYADYHAHKNVDIEWVGSPSVTIMHPEKRGLDTKIGIMVRFICPLEAAGEFKVEITYRQPAVQILSVQHLRIMQSSPVHR